MHNSQKRLCFVIVVLCKITHIYILCMTDKWVNSNIFFHGESNMLTWSFLNKFRITLHFWGKRNGARDCEHSEELRGRLCTGTRMSLDFKISNLKNQMIKTFVLFLGAEGTREEVLMLKGNLSPYLDTHNEEESSYVTLSNRPIGIWQFIVTISVTDLRYLLILYFCYSICSRVF